MMKKGRKGRSDLPSFPDQVRRKLLVKRKIERSGLPEEGRFSHEVTTKKKKEEGT